MNLLKNKFSEFAIMVPILLFIVIAGYFFYSAYSELEQSKKNVQYTKYFKALNKVLYEAGEAQVAVARYLGTYGRTDVKHLEFQWKRVDSAVAELKETVDEKLDAYTEVSALLAVLENMNEERKAVSSLNINPMQHMYAIASKKQILETMRKSLAYQKDDQVNTLFEAYFSLAHTSDNIFTENALVTYFMSRAGVVNEDESALWDQVKSSTKSPTYKHIKVFEVLSKLEDIFESAEYKSLQIELQDIRSRVATAFLHGDFTPSLLEQWQKVQKERNAILKRAQDTIYRDTVNILERQMNTKSDIMKLSAFIIVILLIIVFIVHKLFVGMARESKELESILKNLEYDKDISQEYNLTEILKENDKAKIYKFLETIVLDAKESKRAAEKANQTKSLFLANMSHEIRTPLNGIVGFTSLLKSSSLNMEQEEFVQIIEKSSENLLTVINDILDLSKIESEKVEIESIAFDPIIEFESGIEAYGAKAAEKNIELGLYIDPKLAQYELMGDPNRIKQVIVNLISNSIKFTPVEGVVNVRIEIVHSDNQQVTIHFSVQDTGIGISEEQQDKIFEAFSQEDSSTSRQFGGTGLGLTISSKLVELMGGSLRLESKKNQGATFFFSLSFEYVSLAVTAETFDQLHIGYYQPASLEAKISDQNIQRYMNAFSKNTELCTDIEELTLRKGIHQPDVLFIKYDYTNVDELTKLLKLRSKIVLLTTVYKQEEVASLEMDFLKVLYAPINYNKIKSSLTLATGQETVKEAEKVKKFKDLKVLVAEDNLINQKLIKRVLEEIGTVVTVVDNGEIAFKKRIVNNYDLIFMDIQMPVMNGIEATHAILNYEKENNLPHIPIVALTANALKGDREKYLAEGMDDYATKPIQIDHIRNIISAYFPEKLEKDEEQVEENIVEEIPVPKDKYTDILLCKQEKQDGVIFEVILKKIGYSVEVAKDLKEFKQLLRRKYYKYALFDKHLTGLYEDGEVDDLLKDASVKTILFMDNIRLATSRDHHNYTLIAPNVPNSNLLRSLILKLDESSKFEM